jgi:tripartite-type tricarboxylate transporter receptor subunit TctC
MVAPFAPGGQADLLCRKIGASMGAAWNQTVITENKVGAGGLIGADVIAKSAPDGYTLGVIVPGILIQGFLDDKSPFDVIRDFTPISCVVQNPKCIVTNADVPAATLKELVDLVRKDPARYGSYGTSGFGSRAHIAMALINDMAKTKFVHVPYRGAGAVIPDLMGGQLPVGVLDLSSVFAQMSSGKVRVIAVTGLTRSAALPNVPTVAETFPGFHAEEWYGLVAPAGVPSDIVGKIHGEVKRWIGSADAESYSKTFGVELIGGSPEELRKFIESEHAHFAKLIPQLNIKVDAAR